MQSAPIGSTVFLLYSKAKRKYNSAMKTRHLHERGAVRGSTIAVIGLTIALLGTGTLAVWSYLNYNEQKTNVDGKIELAQAQAAKAQADKDADVFAQREKEPNRTFVGPDDYGRLTFDYPKTWSSYVARDTRDGGKFEAYLNPVNVPPVSAAQRFSLRVTIEERDYDTVIKTYDALVKKGDLRAGAAAANGHNGTRFDGNFSKDIRGAAVVYKIRDKTLTIRTDADTFKPDFEALIKTIDFNT